MSTRKRRRSSGPPLFLMVIIVICILVFYWWQMTKVKKSDAVAMSPGDDLQQGKDYTVTTILTKAEVIQTSQFDEADQVVQEKKVEVRQEMWVGDLRLGMRFKRKPPVGKRARPNWIEFSSRQQIGGHYTVFTTHGNSLQFGLQDNVIVDPTSIKHLN